MTTILRLQSGANLKSSVTRQIGKLALDALKARHPSARVITRDLVSTPPPHLTPAFVASMFSDKAEGLDFELSDQLIAELFEADVYLIEAPMYNFGVPSVLKAWIDHVVRTRKTFRSTPTGVDGLLKDKKAILVVGSGYFYTEGPFMSFNFHEPYLRATLGFIGVTDVQAIRIERLNMGPDNATAAIELAKQQVNELLVAAV